ncbi:MAG: hypothetical protein ACREEM_00175 [Blastocatellia bacterium]
MVIAAHSGHLQQQQVNRPNEKLEDTRAKIAEIKSNQPKVAEEIKRAEGNLSREADPAKHNQWGEIQQSMKSESERLIQMETQAREQETRLAGQLQVEQAKLAELNER